MAQPIREIETEMETRLEGLGMEMVQLEWAGSDQRPILRLRVDFSDSTPGKGVTVDDCVMVSRALEPWLDAHAELPDRYVLEVSSPGVNRPLRKRRDFERFVGREVAVKGPEVLADRATYLEGELIAVEETGDGARVLLRLGGGDELSIPLSEISGAHLIHRWD